MYIGERESQISEKEPQLAASNVMKRFGKDLSYDEVVAILPSLSDRDRIQIVEYIYEKQQEFWNKQEVVRYYSEIYPDSPFVADHFSRLASLLSPEAGDVVVDLGCGCGILTKALFEKHRDRDFAIIGIDYSAGALEKSSQLNSADVKPGKLELINHDLREGIPLPRGSADRVVSNWGIFYLQQEDLRIALHEVYRVLGRGGIFACTTIMKGNVLSVFQRRVIKEMLESFRTKGLKEIVGIVREGLRTQKNLHFLFPMYSEEEILTMLREARFEVAVKEYSLSGASMTCVAKKIDRSMSLQHTNSRSICSDESETLGY